MFCPACKPVFYSVSSVCIRYISSRWRFVQRTGRPPDLLRGKREAKYCSNDRPSQKRVHDPTLFAKRCFQSGRGRSPTALVLQSQLACYDPMNLKSEADFFVSNSIQMVCAVVRWHWSILEYSTSNRSSEVLSTILST